MLRFLPDSWLEGLLRPFILADPLAGIYFEDVAPDVRFTACLVFMAIALMAGRAREHLLPHQVRTAGGLLVMFYIWTFVSGNGRYFISGLLLIGPLLVLACRLLPGTRAMRMSALALVVAMQGLGLNTFYEPNTWGFVRWRDGPGLSIEASPLRERPAVFLTISSISYSILVPRFHPQARWANIAGQRNIVPGFKEYARLQSLLASDLPKYILAPLSPTLMSPQMQPVGEMRAMFQRSLSPHGLALVDGACQVLRSSLSVIAPGTFAKATPDNPSGAAADSRPSQGFWVCLLKTDTATTSPDPATTARLSEGAPDVFDLVEQRCPRFFPPGNGKQQVLNDVVLRHYTNSDVRLYVDDEGRVSYRYFRAVNRTLIGSVDQVRRGDFKVDCEKLPGRYQLPWQRG